MTCTTCDLGTADLKPAPTPETPAGTCEDEDAKCKCGAKMKTFDPLDECQPNDDGWANLDMDSLTGGYEYMKSGVSAIPQSQIETKISLTFGTKEAHMDSDRRVHGETTFPSPIEPAPAITDFVYQALNKRYFLPCKQRGCENPIESAIYNAQCD